MMKQCMMQLVFLLTLVSASNASIIINMVQDGLNVVATGAGTANLTNLTPYDIAVHGSYLDSINGILYLGSNFSAYSSYSGLTSGPGFFGSSTDIIQGSNVAGNSFGIMGRVGHLLLPYGYVSGTQLSGSATWANENFTSLGVTPETYTWTWGSGANADFLTLNIGQTAVPEPSTYILLSIALGAVGFARKKMNRQA
jgi:hypothetical protein